MIEIKNKQILIDGKPRLIMAGEIHYFRLDRKDWQDRINKLKKAGCNTVASYVPWLCHEPLEGKVDLEGNTRPELDLGAFIDLCQENGLYFFLRPGPFIMAEIKNEGIPYWVIEKHPEIVPITWDGKKVSTHTLDYLAPGFLKEARKWYKHVMAVAKPRLYNNGGNIIGVQLDNEIGMLSWVSNSPDLTDNVLEDFTWWLKDKYGINLKKRYPFSVEDFGQFSQKIRSPEEEYAGELRQDLGYYMRNRYARYVATLRGYAEENGVKDIPFVVNIHGTSHGRGFTFPIGISQLYEAYTQGPGYLSGSDIYFGNLNMETFQDLYLINGFMDAVHNSDQPLTSIEFNCGDGNFGNNYSGRLDPWAADFKTRMCIAQGHRMINFYLMAGGYNYRLDPGPDDGNDRIAHTGERHGFAAPISPEGELNYTYPRMARVNRTMMAVGEKLARMEEEHDELAFAFIPDYYMTEYKYPDSEKMNNIVRNLETHRSHGAWEIMARAMLLANYRFGAIDIQNNDINPEEYKALVLPSARYMNRDLQKRLVQYMNQGGGILLYGEIPQYDLEGKPCTVLAKALGVIPKKVLHNSRDYYLSVVADGWAAPRPEGRTHFAQVFETFDVEPIMRVYGTEEICGFSTMVGKGQAIVLATAYDCDIPLFKEALIRLGVEAKLIHDYHHHGIFMTSSSNDEGERFIHLLNLDGFDKEFYIYDQGEKLFEGRKILLQSKDGVMLPLNVKIGEMLVEYSTAEIVNIEDNFINFRLTQSKDIIVLRTEKGVLASKEYKVEVQGDKKIITSNKHAKVDDNLTVYFS